MEKFGIYQILQALGGLSGAQTEKEQVPAPQSERATAQSQENVQPLKNETSSAPAKSFLPPPAYFNARMLEIIQRHETISRRIDQKYEKRD